MEDASNHLLVKNLQALMADAFQVSLDDITHDLAFGDLPQWDSMGHMELMMRLEETYGIDVNADTIAEMVTLPAIFEKITQRDQTNE